MTTPRQEEEDDDDEVKEGMERGMNGISEKAWWIISGLSAGARLEIEAYLWKYLHRLWGTLVFRRFSLTLIQPLFYCQSPLYTFFVAAGTGGSAPSPWSYIHFFIAYIYRASNELRKWCTWVEEGHRG